MTTLDLQPLTVTVPLWEDPPGVFRVGKSRVLLELVLRAFQRGDTPEAIVHVREVGLAAVDGASRCSGRTGRLAPCRYFARRLRSQSRSSGSGRAQALRS